MDIKEIGFHPIDSEKQDRQLGNILKYGVDFKYELSPDVKAHLTMLEVCLCQMEELRKTKDYKGFLERKELAIKILETFSQKINSQS